MWPNSGVGAHLAAAHADGLDRVVVDAQFITSMLWIVLLDDVVAAEPDEVVPVADLPLHVAPAFLPVGFQKSPWFQ